MKYCLNYSVYSKELNNVEEVIIRAAGRNLSKLQQYIKEHKEFNERFIVSIENFNLEDIKIIEAIKEEENVNLVLRFQDLYYKEIYVDKLLDDINLEFFFNTKVDTWDKLNVFINLGVSDIYISGDLGFSLPKVRKQIESLTDKKVNIRVIPNFATPDTNLVNDLKKFFIRPEEIDDYAEYVDIFEIGFRGDRIEDVILKAYKHKKWKGYLRELISGVNPTTFDLDSRLILSDAAFKRRVHCDRKCMKGHVCRICDAIYELSCTLRKEEQRVWQKEHQAKKE